MFLEGLLATGGRKTGSQLAERLGETAPDGMQRLLGSAHWDAGLVRNDLCGLISESFGSRDGLLVVTGYEFIKKGSHSVGVHRQFSPRLGRVANCQVGIFGVYEARGRQFICDRELYLPKTWIRDGRRRVTAGIPEGTRYRPKHDIVREIAERMALMRMPMRILAADEPHGCSPDIRRSLERMPQPYVLGVASQYRVPLRVGGQSVTLSPAAVPRAFRTTWLPGDGGARAAGYWTRIPVAGPLVPGLQRDLLVHASTHRPRRVRGFITFAPRDTPLEELARYASGIDRAATCVVAAGHQVGLDGYEVRQWASWYRHVTLCALAHYCLSAAAAHRPADFTRRA